MPSRYAREYLHCTQKITRVTLAHASWSTKMQFTDISVCARATGSHLGFGIQVGLLVGKPRTQVHTVAKLGGQPLVNSQAKNIYKRK